METNSSTSSEDKTVAILSYITLIGFIIAIVMHGNQKTKLGAYHLKQALGLMLTSIGAWMAFMIIAFIPFVNFLLLIIAPLTWIGVLVLLILGIVNAANGEMKPLPIVGALFEKWFANSFN